MEHRYTPIFVGGTGRCGTGQLVKTLERHPLVVRIKRETRVLAQPGGLFSLYEIAKRYGRVPTDQAIHNWRLLCESQAEDMERFVGPIMPLVEKTIARVKSGDIEEACRDFVYSLMDRVYRPRVDFIVEKTPRNILCIRTILELFPECKFIHIKRDPREVIASWARMDWSPRQGDIAANFAHLKNNWYGPWMAVRDWARKQPQYYEVKMEDICHDPPTAMRDLADFCGIKRWAWPTDCFQLSKRKVKLEGHPERRTLDKLAPDLDGIIGGYDDGQN